MKRIAIIGVVILSVFFFGTCGAGPAGDVSEDGLTYTNVAYSDDRTEVTIYLDGTKVPDRSAQRAVNTDLAKMSYDFLEAVFCGTATMIARASWDLGQSAGISGVYRGSGGTGQSYVDSNGPGSALLFAGKKSNKTLLGVGKLTAINGTATTNPVVDSATTSVTFTLTAVKTGLFASDGTSGSNIPAATAHTHTESFRFYNSASTPGLDALDNTNSALTPIGVRKYPIYSLSTTTTAYTKNAGFKFGGGAIAGGIILAEDITDNNIQRRIPRYLDGGRYFDLRTNPDTTTKVVFRDVTLPISAGTLFNTAFPSALIPLAFKVDKASSGAFSFYIEIPVYAVTTSATSNGGGAPIKWWIRTGLGSELYSIDDGSSTGGSVLMGVGVNAIDWIDIDWEWTP